MSKVLWNLGLLEKGGCQVSTGQKKTETINRQRRGVSGGAANWGEKAQLAAREREEKDEEEKVNRRQQGERKTL